MFKKYFLIILFTFALPFGHAQDSRWEFVGKTANSDKFLYIDKLTIQREGNEVTYWEKVNYDKSDEFGDLSSKSRRVMNCKTREVRLRYVMAFKETDNKGEITMNENISGANALFVPIPPDSVAEEFYFRICGKK